MRLALAAVFAFGLATAARAQTPLTGTTGPQTSTPPITSPVLTKAPPAARKQGRPRLHVGTPSRPAKATGQ